MRHPDRTCFTSAERHSLEPPDPDDAEEHDEDGGEPTPAEERRWWLRLAAWMQRVIPEPPKEPKP